MLLLYYCLRGLGRHSGLPMSLNHQINGFLSVVQVEEIVLLLVVWVKLLLFLFVFLHQHLS